MLGLNALGSLHTAVSLVAIVAGAIALIRDKEISSTNGLGKLYAIATVITCATGFGIFHHGGFGPAHAVGAITLVVLAAAALAEYTRTFGRASRYVAIVGWSATYFFSWIPAILETATRLPPSAPLFATQQAPALQAVPPVLFVVFLVGAALQIRRERAKRALPLPA